MKKAIKSLQDHLGETFGIGNCTVGMTDTHIQVYTHKRGIYGVPTEWEGFTVQSKYVGKVVAGPAYPKRRSK